MGSHSKKSGFLAKIDSFFSRCENELEMREGCLKWLFGGALLGILVISAFIYAFCYPPNAHVYPSEWNNKVNCKNVGTMSVGEGVTKVKYYVEVTYPAPEKRGSTKDDKFEEIMKIFDFGMGRETVKVVHNTTSLADRERKASFYVTKVFEKAEHEPHLLGEMQLKNLRTEQISFKQRFELNCNSRVFNKQSTYHKCLHAATLSATLIIASLLFSASGILFWKE